MPISVIQAALLWGGFSGNFPNNVSNLSTILFGVTAYNAAGAAISSNTPLYNGATPTGSALLKGIQSPVSGGDSVYSAAWMLPDVAGGAKSVGITVPNGNNVSSTGLVAIEVAGLGASPVLDQFSVDSASTGAPTSGMTPDITEDPELIFAVAACFAQSITPPGAPFTDYQAGLDYGAVGWQIVTSSGAGYEYACTGGGATWCDLIVTIAGTSAAPKGNLLIASL
jgi:hypothetical protein